MIIFDICIFLTGQGDCPFTPLAVCLRGWLSWTNEYVEKHPLVCVYWIWHVLTEGPMAFYGKGLLAMAGSCDAFFKKQCHCPLHWKWTGWVDTTNTSRAGFKIQTLHVLWDWVAYLRRRRTLSAKVSQQCMLCEHCSSMCQSSHFEQCMGGDVYGCDCKTQRSEVEEAPSVRWCYAGWVCRYHFQTWEKLLVWESCISYLEESFWTGCRHVIL